MQFPSPYEHILPTDIPCISSPPLPDQFNVKDRIRGSMLGLATGDALGASVEFMPHQHLLAHPVSDMQSGGTWGLKAGQWTDDTSMALCLASSLITTGIFDPYSQMVRYKWWYKYGFLSSTGYCFDIGKATRNALNIFSQRQKILQQAFGLHNEIQVDSLSFKDVGEVSAFDVNCSGPDVAGNGSLMRLAPVPLYYFRNPALAVELSGQSARLTHGSEKAIDACRYHAALIVAALRGESKEQLLNKQFYHNHRAWFGVKDLCTEVLHIALGSYKKPGGYEMGIRGSGYIIKSLEAALWAFWSDENSFQNGVLAAVNLGDDTDTTAAIYGQLAGAYYGAESILPKWLKQLYAKDFIICISDWLYYFGQQSHSTVHMKNNMYYHVPTQLHKKYSNPPISMRRGMFQSVVPRQAHKAKNYDSYLRDHLPNPPMWTFSQAHIRPQYQQRAANHWAPYSKIFQRPFYSGQF
ncbi:unnamed protein product [Rotaria socialis]|uniref:ADP-ribosylglycohydrolase n=1 Tax=Rotaria socialis TaxID=392032 RepID=A0A820MKF5_9BILA|nr:unnamed protein product [Rotaria socialis]CAF3387807.1 unnamed protein product [Rotaria socialis]CAF3424444.1 unnamed protein product [Rotaria socialis]CAF3604930.1 unnamed protein product [Rotaria socialis]CAF4376781.1 unnamed protein product [Rotaria socialis]